MSDNCLAWCSLAATMVGTGLALDQKWLPCAIAFMCSNLIQTSRLLRNHR